MASYIDHFNHYKMHCKLDQEPETAIIIKRVEAIRNGYKSSVIKYLKKYKEPDVPGLFFYQLAVSGYYNILYNVLEKSISEIPYLNAGLEDNKKECFTHGLEGALKSDSISIIKYILKNSRLERREYFELMASYRGQSIPFNFLLLKLSDQLLYNDYVDVLVRNLQ